MSTSTYLTSTILSKETMAQFKNANVLGRNIDFSFSDKFGVKDNQIGTSYSVRRPVLPQVVMGNIAYNAAKGAITESTVQLAINSSLSVTMNLDDTDFTLRIEDFSDRYLKNVVVSIAATLDSDIANLLSNCTIGGTAGQVGAGWVYGAAGTPITSNTILQAKRFLQDSSAPMTGFVGALTPQANAELANAQITLFNDVKSVSKIYSEGFIGKFAGTEFYTSQNLATHVNGGVSALAIGAGSAVLSAGWAETGVFTVTSTGATINAGDVFTVAGVYWVNPLTKAITSNLAQFTVISSAAAGATSLTVSPAPITAGPYQNISTTVASKTASLIGAIGAVSQESLIFHQEAIGGASVPFSLPKDSNMAYVTKTDNFNIRFVNQYDVAGVGTGNGLSGFLSKFDAIYGIKVLRPEWIVRIRD